MGKETINSCLNCSYLLYCDAADTGYRCGHSYFSVPPKERRASRMDAYPEIALDAFCEKWKSHNQLEVAASVVFYDAIRGYCGLVAAITP